MKVLVDTSAWIHALRKQGKSEIRLAVKAVLDDGSACLCEPVLLELWNGIAGKGTGSERRFLSQLQNTLDILPCTPATWGFAYRLAHRARSAGLTVPAVDVLISAIAGESSASLLHDDKHFDQLLKLKS